MLKSVSYGRGSGQLGVSALEIAVTPKIKNMLRNLNLRGNTICNKTNQSKGTQMRRENI